MILSRLPGFSILVAAVGGMACLAAPQKSALKSATTGSGPRASAAGTRRLVPTFTKDIAPVIFQRCTPCHHTDGAAPFPLETYQDVKRRAAQIAVVTQSRYMPPWRPGPEFKGFQDDRHLTNTQTALIKHWVDGGAREGRRSELPKPPPVIKGWRLGKPDMVVTMPKPYNLPGETREPFRCFVIPLRLPRDTWVRAVEYLPGVPQIVRHASVFVDTTGKGRQLEEDSGAVGYMEFDAGVGLHTSGSICEWAPGVSPLRLPEATAQLIPKGSDLVLLLHFKPDGKPEQEQSRVGLYFASLPPQRSVTTLVLGSRKIYLQPGMQAAVKDSFTVPVAVQLLNLSLNAHYIGKKLRVTATLPNRTQKLLLSIKDWDMDWKEPYRYASPRDLPAGTRLSIEYQFDNRSSNPRNPHNPPHKVFSGPECLEEMATLWVQTAPQRPQDQAALIKALQQKREPQVLYEEAEEKKR